MSRGFVLLTTLPIVIGLSAADNYSRVRAKDLQLRPPSRSSGSRPPAFRRRTCFMAHGATWILPMPQPRTGSNGRSGTESTPA